MSQPTESLGLSLHLSFPPICLHLSTHMMGTQQLLCLLHSPHRTDGLMKAIHLLKSGHASGPLT